MRITVLIDNGISNTSLIPAKGFAALIESGDAVLLFDTGPGAACLENARRLNVDLSRVTHIVLSHGHYDHSGGLPHIASLTNDRPHARRPALIAHPDAFLHRYAGIRLGPLRISLRRLGAPLNRGQAARLFRLRESRAPLWLNDEWVFLGEIPVRPGEGRRLGRIVRDGKDHADPISDDSALVRRGPGGLVILVGCGHAGICNIIEYARAVTGEQRVQAVIGGFHLRSAAPATIRSVARYFEQLAPGRLHACHCTGHARRRLPGQQDIGAGSVIEID